MNGRSKVPAFAGVRLVTTAEVAKFLGYADPHDFLKAAKAAGIPYCRINPKRILWNEADVLRWIASRTVGRKPAA